MIIDFLKPKSFEEICLLFEKKYKEKPIAFVGDKITPKKTMEFKRFRYKTFWGVDILKPGDVLKIKRIYMGRISLRPMYVVINKKGDEFKLGPDDLEKIN